MYSVSSLPSPEIIYIISLKCLQLLVCSLYPLASFFLFVLVIVFYARVLSQKSSNRWVHSNFSKVVKCWFEFLCVHGWSLSNSGLRKGKLGGGYSPDLPVLNVKSYMSILINLFSGVGQFPQRKILPASVCVERVKLLVFWEVKIEKEHGGF